jgi:hypothetical protein
LEKSGYTVEKVTGAGFPFFNLYKFVLILRGAKLIQDVNDGNRGNMSNVARWTMKIFDFLFRFNLDSTRLGWQIVAVARPKGGPFAADSRL